MSFHPNLASFARKMRFRANEADRNTNRTVRKVALAAHQTVAIATPVDTGQARSNWWVTLGSPTDATREAFFPGEKGSTAAQNVAAVLGEGRSVISGRRNGTDVWISNNLPYIGKLNQGSSAQAPAMFVQQAVEVAARVVANATIFEAP